MAQYTIKELEHLSGIKAHTIRVWEQRYNILCPKRTETNIRFYDDADLKALLNISLLNEHGFKISKIAQMQPEQIAQKVQQLSDEPCLYAHQINNLIAAMVDMDEERFDKTLTTSALQIGFSDTMYQVIYPFLHKIGILWQTGKITPAHEHFVSNLVRQKLIVAIDGQVVRRQEGAKPFLLYLPEGELHEIALLYMHYILRSHNKHVIYLGQNLPFSDLELTVEQCQPQNICTVLTTSPDRDNVQAYIDQLSARFPAARIYMYGYQVQYDFLTFPHNVQKLSCIHDLVPFIS